MKQILLALLFLTLASFSGTTTLAQDTDREGVVVVVDDVENTADYVNAMTDAIPPEWIVSPGTEPLYEIHIIPASTEIESCDYGANTMIRVEIAAEIIITNLKTSDEIARKRFAGFPSSCSFIEQFPLGSNTKTEYGVPDTGTIQTWLFAIMESLTGFAVERDPGFAMTLIGHTDGIKSIDFSSDGSKIVTAGQDDTIRIWDTGTGEQLLQLKEGANSVDFSPDGQRVVTANMAASTVQVRSAETSASLLQIDILGDADSASFSPDGTKILVSTVFGTFVFDSTTGQELLSMLPPGIVFRAVYSPDGSSIATVGTDGIQIWDAKTGEQLKTFETESIGLRNLAYSPDGTALMVSDFKLTIMDAETGIQKLQFSGYSAGTFSADGKFVVTVDAAKPAMLWDAVTGEELRELPVFGNTVSYSPDGQYIAIGSASGVIELWDVSPTVN